mgnify:FL=1
MSEDELVFVIVFGVMVMYVFFSMVVSHNL